MLELRYQDGTILVFIRDDESVTSKYTVANQSAENERSNKELFLGHFRSLFSL